MLTEKQQQHNLRVYKASSDNLGIICLCIIFLIAPAMFMTIVTKGATWITAIMLGVALGIIIVHSIYTRIKYGTYDYS